jgi:hypothetical protein
VIGMNWHHSRARSTCFTAVPAYQRFSVAGLSRANGRDKWPEFKWAVLELRPATFVAEKILGTVGSTVRPVGYPVARSVRLPSPAASRPTW